MRAPGFAGDGTDVVDHLAQVDAKGVLVAEDVVADGIADEDDVDPRLVDDPCERGVVSGHHDERGSAPGPLTGRDFRD